MSVVFKEELAGRLSAADLGELIRKSLAPYSGLSRVLLIHADYSRHDYSDLVAPALYESLSEKGLKRLDTLNAGGTHREMTDQEILDKLGFDRKQHPLLGTLYNHIFDDPNQLMNVVDIPADFVAEKTSGHLQEPMAVTVNKLICDDYDLIIALSGTVPHEAIGFSGGLKMFFPGISGPEVIGLLHWAAVLIGIPEIIGKLDNPARDVVLEGAKHIFKLVGDTPIISLNMLFSEEGHRVVPKGFYCGCGLEGFIEAHRMAATASAEIHIVYIDQPQQVVVQQIPEMYDEIWTAGKGSYKLQKPGVIADGGKVVIFAPHIDCFHSNKTMDEEIRQIGYHCCDWVVDYVKRNPDFNKNVASHVINVRGPGVFADGIEKCAFEVVLATQIPEAECKAVGLGYLDPNTLDASDFKGSGQLWIEDGAKWLYDRS